MNTLSKRFLSGVIALLMVISLIPVSTSAAPASSKIYTTPTGYDEASDVRYSTSTVSGKQVIANWGARGEDCVFLSTYAQNFYTGAYTFDAMSALSGGSSQSNASSSQLYNELQELMTSQHTFYTYYDGNENVRDYYMYADCVSNDTSQVALLYRGGLVTSEWNKGEIWNQEHIWPQSKLSNSKQIGDIMHLRPANPSENSSRGNTAYGEGSGYYNPGPSVRGDCARIVLYMYVRWGITNTWGSSGVMQSADVLLDWMEEDPVDTWEMGRNDAVQSITGTRNVFVDYPEYAWLLFGQDVPENMTTPSGSDGVTANPGGSTTPTTPAPTTPSVAPTNPAPTTPNVAPTSSAPTTPNVAPTSPAPTTPNAAPTTPAPTTPGVNATTPGVDATTPGVDSTTPGADPLSPAPMPTNPIPQPVPSEKSDYTLWIVLAVVGLLLIGGGVTAVILIKKKKLAAVADAPAEDAPAEDAPTEEAPVEDAPIEEAPVEETLVENTDVTE